MTPPTAIREADPAALRLLARQFPTPDAALAELARLAAVLTLPKGTVHVISDVHGEDGKLRHVINNASGRLRRLVEERFADRLGLAALGEFLTLIFYPRETLEQVEPTLRDPAARRAYAESALANLFEIVRALAQRYSLARTLRRFPDEYRGLFMELLHNRRADAADFLGAAVEALVRQGRAFHFLRLAVRLVRDLAIDELIIGGDCWDRGPRGDRVMGYLQRQPNVLFTWGNHDAAWLGAGLGHEALIAHVLRISLRYRRLAQLEEGYGISLEPLEHLARTVYADDPAASYHPKGKPAGLREDALLARMHKAAALMQFKLEGPVIERNPAFRLDGRRLLHRIDHAAGTVAVDDKAYALRDTHFPTLDPAHPYELSAEERACLDAFRQAFVGSQVLWEQLRFLVRRGAMWLCRDDHLIFHGCVPVDERGEFLALEVDGRPRRGRDLFDAIGRVVLRALDAREDKDLDLLWYLWSGPLSPLFGKDKIATFEADLVADPAARVETKNPYFRLLHEADFCERVLAEFGADPQRGLIVNGHIPVKIDEGESPLKRSGKAITIDGAFSEAYGDHGYTLVLEPDRTFLAKHHHFESVEAAVRDGVDIIPSIMEVRGWEPPRRAGDTEQGEELRGQIALLEQLVEAYRANRVRPG